MEKIIKICQFEKFNKISSLKNKRISQILEFRKLASFQSLIVWKTIRIPKMYIVEKYSIFQVFE